MKHEEILNQIDNLKDAVESLSAYVGFLKEGDVPKSVDPNEKKTRGETTLSDFLINTPSIIATTTDRIKEIKANLTKVIQNVVDGPEVGDTTS